MTGYVSKKMLGAARLPDTPTVVEVGDLVYIHESYGPLPKDLFAVVTRVAHRLPALDDRYPPVSVELWVFKGKPKSWYEPEHLTILEKKYG